MEHARKLVLVDPRFARPSMREKTLSSLDYEIESVLSSDAPDDEKAKKYIQTLKRFKYYEEVPTAPKKQIEKLEPSVLQSLPLHQQHRAKRLLDHLKNNTPEVDFNEQGELIHRQSRIPKSNIVDLIDDVTRTKTTVAPVGWEELAASLRASKVSKELVANPQRRKYTTDPLRTSTRKQRNRALSTSWMVY